MLIIRVLQVCNERRLLQLTLRTTRNPAQTTAGTLPTPTLWGKQRLWESGAARTPVMVTLLP